MFGRDGKILLWVDAEGRVINGNWYITYHPETDEVSNPDMPDVPRMQRLCDMDRNIVRRGRIGVNGYDYDYNDMIDAHQKLLDNPIPLQVS